MVAGRQVVSCRIRFQVLVLFFFGKQRLIGRMNRYVNVSHLFRSNQEPSETRRGSQSVSQQDWNKCLASISSDKT